jgi:hypothetical protein
MLLGISKEHAASSNEFVVIMLIKIILIAKRQLTDYK